MTPRSGDFPTRMRASTPSATSGATRWRRRRLGAWLALASALSLSACSDAVEGERPKEILTAPGPLVAGVAEVKMPVPIGIGTMGYGALDVEPSVTPFADKFPGTTRQHGALTLKAVALSRGEGHELILVRTDTVGVFQHLREAVLDELERRTGRDYDEALVIAGNHTHSGPGRLLMVDGLLTLLGDTFFPEFYERVLFALVDVIEDAIADQRPAEVGYALAGSSDAHNDRRCENDALMQLQESPDLPVIAVRRAGTIDAVVASYAYHGTILGLDDLTLSGDMGGAAEQRISERFDHPVTVLLFNSWGGDMAPGDVETDAVGAEQPGAYDRMDGLGELLADAIMPKVESVTFDAEPTVRARTFRTRVDREALGYQGYDFDYPNGGVYCGLGGQGNCDDDMPLHGLDDFCVAFDAEEPAPKQTLFTAGQIGDLYFITGTGEWSTQLAGDLLDRMRERTGADAMFLGYANDYTGYSLTERDWWQGGYETGGALWGPKQGDYLAARAFEAFASYVDTFVAPPYEQPAPIAPFSGYAFDPRVAETALDLGVVATDVLPSATATDVVTFAVHGSDPWLGTPVATLERDDGGSFVPVLRNNGRPLESDGYDFWVELTVSPSYADAPNAPARAFLWSFHLPVRRRAAGPSAPTLTGDHRLRVALPTADGDTVVVESATFTVE